MKRIKIGILILFVINSILLYSLEREHIVVAGVKSDSVEKYKGKIAITFDDGPNPLCTGRLLDGLYSRGVKATFFVVGEKAKEHPELILKMKEYGNLIGNHTYSHIQLTSQNETQFLEEVKKTNQLIKQITGEDVVFIRPPYGIWKESFEKELNMFPVLWTVDPKDWYVKDSGVVIQSVVDKVKENSIILLHDDYDTSVSAAFVIVDILKARGYEFVPVDEILFD